MAAEQFHAVGKRKSAVARVWLRPGKGTFTINKKPMEEYIARELDRLVIKQPLELTDTLGKYDISVNVRGGGIAGQAGAIRHGISRALLIVNPDYRIPLRKATFLTRDSRVKERKKYGMRGPRARYQFSKR